MWHSITVGSTVNTVHSVQVYIQSGDRTWGNVNMG